MQLRFICVRGHVGHVCQCLCLPESESIARCTNNSPPNCLWTNSYLAEVTPQLLKCPVLATGMSSCLRLHCVVTDMCTKLFESSFSVTSTAEADKTFSKYQRTKNRRKLCHNDVDSKVNFPSFNQQWIGNVSRRSASLQSLPSFWSLD